MAMPMGTATDITITIAMTGITKENTTIGITAMMIDALLRIPRSWDPRKCRVLAFVIRSAACKPLY
jgi:hypothetical protein